MPFARNKPGSQRVSRCPMLHASRPNRPASASALRRSGRALGFRSRAGSLRAVSERCCNPRQRTARVSNRTAIKRGTLPSDTPAAKQSMRRAGGYGHTCALNTPGALLKETKTGLTAARGIIWRMDRHTVWNCRNGSCMVTRKAMFGPAVSPRVHRLPHNSATVRAEAAVRHRRSARTR